MNAVGVYCQTAQLLLRIEPNSNSNEQFIDLNRLLGHLRQLLACAVCSRLLNDPFAPRERKCQHNVCRLCIRGHKSLRPPCTDCKDCLDFKTYAENPQMRCLLLCFKSLCEHVIGAPSLFQQLCKQKQTLPAVVSSQPSTVPIAQMSTQEYIVEGANYTDISSAFSTDLPRSIAPITAAPPRLLHIPPQLVTGSQVPPLATSAGATSLVPVSALHILAQSQTAPKASTPPTNTLPNNTSSSILIKQEPNTSPPAPLPPPLSTVSNKINAINTQHVSALHTQPLSVKRFVDLSAIKQLTSVVVTTTTVTPPVVTPTITYVGGNAPSVVVPIVSSSATTTAPLSIASSRFQTLNRNLAQARRPVIGLTGSGEAVPPLAFKVSLAPTSTVSIQTLSNTSTTAATTTIAAAATAAATTSQVRNPPPIKTVSNGSAMYSVLYTGIGNKITIKRKTDGDDDVNQKKNVSTSTATAPAPATATPVFRQVTISKPLNQNKRRGCRCGNATPTPGKLTCCGQRCPCYVDSKSCIGCKCRGCRNPHRPDGGKVRPVIPELACYEIQMADESSSLSPREPPLATVTTTLPLLNNTTIRQQQPQQQQQQTLTSFEDYKPLLNQSSHLSLGTQIRSTSSTTTTSLNSVTPTATLIPFRTVQTTTTQQQQQQHQSLHRISALSGTSGNTQKLQHSHLTTAATSTTTNMLQLENLQRESVLIQNADGNYQFVNLFTASSASTHPGNTTQITTLPRIQTINTTNAVTATATSTNLQQQLKQNNLITVHPLNANHHHLQHHNHQQQQNLNSQQQHHTTTMTTSTPLISPSAASSTTTITLSPIIVTSPNTIAADIFSSSDGSVDDFITINSMTPMTTATSPNISNGSSTAHLLPISATTSEATQFSTIGIESLDSAANALLTASSATGAGIIAPTTAHLTPALVEVIESNEL